MKVCNTCRVPKPLDEFNRRSASADGRQHQCRQCHDAQNREDIDSGRRAERRRERYRTDPEWAERRREESRLRMQGKRMTAEVVAIWVEWDLWRCTYCGGPFEDVDHVLAVSKGGSNDPRNLVPACIACNRGPGGKFDREVTEWFGSRSA